MAVDPQNALTTLQVGFAELSSLIVSYAFSAVGAIILLVIGYIVAGLAQRSVNAGLGKIHGFDETLRGFFAKVARYAVLILVVVMVLGQFGVQTASIIAAIGAIGLAIGLALQGTLQNIAAGIMLLALRPFRIGEYVEAGGISGTIEEIGLFATRLRAIDGLYVLAPNSTLWNVPVINYTRNELRRNDATIGIGYGDDIDLAQKTLLDLAAGDSRVIDDPEPTTFVSELGDSAVSVTLRYWTSTADFFAAKLDLTKAAKLAFDREGISIPFPQQEIAYRDLTVVKKKA
jgi:small conductance mechanosensitive channel